MVTFAPPGKSPHYPGDTVVCLRCGLRYIKFWKNPSNKGSGMCRYCEDAMQRERQFRRSLHAP
jgi:hypothetical protein